MAFSSFDIYTPKVDIIRLDIIINSVAKKNKIAVIMLAEFWICLTMLKRMKAFNNTVISSYLKFLEDSVTKISSKPEKHLTILSKWYNVC